MTYKRYFSYGSNMSQKRLCKRVPSAKPLGAYMLKCHDLRFHKKSTDKSNNCPAKFSAKCDAFKTSNDADFVMGRLFTIDAAEVGTLDTREGLGKGYKKKEVSVVNENGESETAFTYYADPKYIDDKLHPFTWYRHHVLIGAKEAAFPDDYIEKIEAIVAKDDFDKKREQQELKIYD